MIAWYVDRLHVSTPDEDIVRDFFSRCERAGFHPLVAVAVAELALARHHENRVHCAWVMGSH